MTVNLVYTILYMKIKELENELDMPRATVRFYEKENLITPSRGSNGYRDYSENNYGNAAGIGGLFEI